MQIEGSVAPGFESVKDLFEREMNIKAEDKAQLCVYHKGEKVVDLWASKEGSFSPDSLINIFSSGKSLETLALASLVDKGLVSYDAKIADYWPEYAANGKSETTVADLMRHEAGLMDFKHTLDPEHLLTENIKNNNIGSIIEGLKPSIPSDINKRRNYHAMTRGWVVNELYRRVEPNGRTLGEFLREDIAEPLEADINVGVKKEDMGRREHIVGLGIGFQFLQSFVPKFLGRKVYYSFAHLFALFAPIVKEAIQVIMKQRAARKAKKANSAGDSKAGSKNNSKRRGAPTPLKGLNIIRDRDRAFDFFNKDIVVQGESSSFNANCSARGLAKTAAMMAAGGSFEGKQYFGQSAWKALHDKADTAKLGGLSTTNFTQGGLNLFTMNGSDGSVSDRALNEGREGFYGWMGLGGSIFQWNPDEEIGFAFVPTSLHMIDIFNERGKCYQQEVLRCIKGA